MGRNEQCLRVTRGLNKVEAGMHAVVNDLLPVDAVLLLEIRVKSGLDAIRDRLPAVIETLVKNCQRAR